jgi:hypothetical protein
VRLSRDVVRLRNARQVLLLLLAHVGGRLLGLSYGRKARQEKRKGIRNEGSVSKIRATRIFF